MLLVLYRLHIFSSDRIKEKRKKIFYFFLATFEQLSLQKAIFDYFWRTFEQRFEKFRATVWEISRNLWQALPGEGGGYSQKNWAGVCGPLPKTLSLFMTKICDIPYPIYDLTINSKPYL